MVSFSTETIQPHQQHAALQLDHTYTHTHIHVHTHMRPYGHLYTRMHTVGYPNTYWPNGSRWCDLDAMAVVGKAVLMTSTWTKMTSTNNELCRNCELSTIFFFFIFGETHSKFTMVHCDVRTKWLTQLSQPLCWHCWQKCIHSTAQYPISLRLATP